jgi:hypothetical protein
MSTTDTFTAEGTRGSEFVAKRYRELLERHKPVLRFDRQYDFRVASVLDVFHNEGNILRTRRGELVARAGGDPALSLELLSAYPEGSAFATGDCLCLAPDVIGDARRHETNEQFAGCMYGRVVEHRARPWVQYWFWFYYNPKNLLGFGSHEGDWEMVQYGLRPDGEIELASYAQHKSGEARSRRELHFDQKTGRPLVFVAPLSHASYFEAGTHPYPVGIDHPYGDGPESRELAVLPFEAWVEWGGHWGRSDPGIQGLLGRGPLAPAHQGAKWSRPASFHAKLRRRTPRAWVGRLMHFVGRLTYPCEPRLRACVHDRLATIEYGLRQRPLRRSRHLYLTVHDGERVIASRIVVGAPRVRGTPVLIPLPISSAQPAVYGSTFNALRQRSRAVRAGELSR